jgi:hypothetical protein
VPKYEESWQLTNEFAGEAKLVAAARAALLGSGVHIDNSRVAVRTDENKEYFNDFRYEVLNEARIGTAPNILRYESVATNSRDAAGPSWLNDMSRATFESDGLRFCLERNESYSDNRVSLSATVDAAEESPAKAIFAAIDAALPAPPVSIEGPLQVQMSNWIRREIKGQGAKLLGINVLLIFATGAFVAIHFVGHMYLPPLLIILAVGFLPLYLWNCLKGILRFTRFQTSPAWRQLASYDSPDSLALKLDRELQAGASQFGWKMLLTRSWLIRRRLFSIWLCPLRNLVWVYQAETINKTNASYSGSDYSAVIFCRDGQSMIASLPPSELAALWTALIARAPWAIFGYSKEVAAQWRLDRGTFIAAADARYEKYLAFGAAGLTVEPLGVFRRKVHQTVGASSAR